MPISCYGPLTFSLVCSLVCLSLLGLVDSVSLLTFLQHLHVLKIMHDILSYGPLMFSLVCSLVCLSFLGLVNYVSSRLCVSLSSPVV